MLLSAVLLFAEGEAANPAAAAGPNLTSMLIPFALMFMVMYFLMIRPAQKQEKMRRLLIANLKKGDKVQTQAGILGVVTDVAEKDDEVTLKIDPNKDVRIKVIKSSVVRVLNPQPEAAEAAAK